MKEKKVKVKVKNIDNNYKFDGLARINKDIIKFYDEDTTYIYDRGIEKIIKESKEGQTVVDFKNEKILLSVENKEIEIPIKIKSKTNTENYISYNYVVENNNITFEIEIEEV